VQATRSLAVSRLERERHYNFQELRLALCACPVPAAERLQEDLRAFGLGALRAALRIQLATQDVGRFMLFADDGAV
jgi:hypothetical protein